MRLRLDFALLSPEGQWGYVPCKELRDWCDANLYGEVQYSHTGMPQRYFITLLDDKDAIHFKLRWGDYIIT